MIKKIFILISFLLVSFIFFVFIFKKKPLQKDKKRLVLDSLPTRFISKSQKKKDNILKIKKSIFFVDWMVDQEIDINQLTSYCPIIYFGSEGNITLFKEKITPLTACKNFLLTKKIDEVYPIDFWQREVNRLTEILKENGFQGLVLDLEIGGLGNQQKVNQINKMVKIISDEFSKNNLYLAVALYGDVFYRKRPFDVAAISLLVDEIMVMAYDFSKSYGQPGPNFPFSGKDIYGYDFQTMINDYLINVPPEKITVIFGMFGYDWQVDEKKRPFSQGKALTLKQIKEKFLRKINEVDEGDIKTKRSVQIDCFLENCLLKRDDKAKEIEINYTLSTDKPDEEGVYRIDYHIVWFEDEESVKIKTDYLKEKGITSISFWAAGYF